MSFCIEVVPKERVDERPEDYNTAAHRISEHPAHVEEADIEFDINATTFDKWLPLILESRGMETQYQSILLPNTIIPDLMDAVRIYKTTGSVPSRSIMSLKGEVCFSTLTCFDANKRWFVRSDDVSGKDGEGADKPITTIDQLLILLTTSWRLYGSYARHKRGSFRLHLLPWDDDTDAMNEFRVFVPPSTDISKSRISAISQYRWWSTIPEAMKGRLPEIVDAACTIFASIQRQGAMSKALAQGFSFDIQWRSSGTQLVELNGFGALQYTGACLFNWVADRHILYDEMEADLDHQIIVRICA